MGRRGEVDVAEPSPAAPGDDGRLARRHEIGDELACRVVEDRGPRRDVDLPRLTGLSVASRALAPAAVAGPEVMRVAKVAQRRLARIHAEHDGSSAAPVAAVRAAARDVCLAAEGRGTVAARAGLHPDLHAVEEHGAILARRSVRSGGAEAGGGRGRRRGWSAQVRERVHATPAAPRVAHPDLEVRCGPVAQPDAPREPIRCPAPTVWPAPTETPERWLYVVYRPLPWSIQTW